MPEQRRSLVEGLDPKKRQEREEAFVFGQDQSAETSPRPIPTPPHAPTAKRDDILPQYISRAPLTTRVRPEIASALKRASLTRQLEGQEPFHVQEIMEQALETWLRHNGYVR